MKASLISTCIMLALLIFVGGCTSQPQPVPVATPFPTPVVTVSMTTTPAPVTLTSQGWNLGWYDDTKGVWSSVIEGSNVSIWFGLNGNVSGSAGCTKYYSAPYTTGNPDTIQIQRPVESTITCQTPTGVVSQDSEYFTDLSWSTTYAIAGDQLQLFDKTGKKILQFDRMA
jgi:heat shock protein HslJ